MRLLGARHCGVGAEAFVISEYFKMPAHLARIHSSCVGQHIDDFIAVIAGRGYSRNVVRMFIRAVAHLGWWADRRHIPIESWSEETVRRFRRHLSRCKCEPNLGVFEDAVARVEQFLDYLRVKAVIGPAPPASPVHKFAVISQQFADWMLRHRGVTRGSLQVYQHVLRPFLVELGEEPARYTADGVRSFVVARVGRLSRPQAHSTVTAIRAFLRFLIAEGRVPPGLALCVPKVPQWRLASLPRYLEAADVARVVRSCDRSMGRGLRDRAILLLLSRLGLRAGDIVGMELDDIDWHRGALRVRGKGRREVLLPLPQDVGDAVFAYLERGRPRVDGASSRVFLTSYAPIQPFSSSVSVSNLVDAALKRAGIRNPPSRGAHLLRHSAATAMLRSGGSLDTIAAVLRHQSSDTTMHYAKVDLRLLESVAQPWPGRAAC